MFKTIIFSIFTFLFFAESAFAVSDPRSVANNKFGINVVVPQAQMNDASTLVNTNGDWGYIVITLTKKERDLGTIQTLLNSLNEKHLIPIIRLATNFDANSGNWEKPSEADANEWANFLSGLYFPTANKYIQVYNEVNRSTEWGGSVDPEGYAKELAKTIDALKAKSDDFFVLNGALDLSLPTSSHSLEAGSYFAQMNVAVPGIFDKIDGLSSHSYPNPNFSASPNFSGRIGINGYAWELSQIASYSSKDLPVFITETGWKRDNTGRNGVSENQISDYYKMAFSTVWNDSRIVSVAPFVLSYPQAPFTQFSFSKDISDSGFYSYFGAIKDMQKIKGDPKRVYKLVLEEVTSSSLLERVGSYIDIKVKNTGNYILNMDKDVVVKVSGSGVVLGKAYWDKKSFYPGEESSAVVTIKNLSTKDVSAKISIEVDQKILAEKEITVYNSDFISLISAKTKTLSASFRSENVKAL